MMVTPGHGSQDPTVSLELALLCLVAPSTKRVLPCSPCPC